MNLIHIRSDDNKRIISLIDFMNLKLIKYNFDMSNDKLLKQYEYVIGLVNQLRNKNIKPSEEYEGIESFLDKYYVEPIRVSSLSKMIKCKCGIKKIRKDIEEELINSKYKIITKHNVSFIVS